MAEEYYIFPRKGRKYLYVQFRDDTGKLGAAVSSGKTSEAAALRWAKEELKKRVLEAQARPRTDMLFGSWIEPFFGPACPYLSRKALDGKSYSKAYVRNSHYYVQIFILPDKELCALPLNRARRVAGPLSPGGIGTAGACVLLAKLYQPDSKIGQYKPAGYKAHGPPCIA